MIPYISIKSVLYDISTMVEDKYWNESHALEWVTRGLRKFNLPRKYEQALGLFAIKEHKTTLPKELRHIVQVAYWNDNEYLNVDNVFKAMGLDQSEYLKDSGLAQKAVDTMLQSTKWKPMKKSTNTFHASVGTDSSVYPQTRWMSNHEYSLDLNNCLTSTLKEGVIMVAYLRYAVDSEGFALIPDDEDLKEALFHYFMYRYWLVRSTLHEQNAGNNRDFHLSMFETLKAKATAKINMPSVDEMENLKNMTMTLVPRAHRWEGFFQQLGAKEISYLPYETH